MERSINKCFSNIRHGSIAAEWPYGYIARASRGIIIHLKPAFRIAKLSSLIETARSVDGVCWLIIMFEEFDAVLEVRYIDFPMDMREEFQCLYRLIQSGRTTSWILGRYVEAAQRLAEQIKVDAKLRMVK
jgi:hypothetical protein